LLPDVGFQLEELWVEGFLRALLGLRARGDFKDLGRSEVMGAQRKLRAGGKREVRLEKGVEAPLSVVRDRERPTPLQ